MTAIAVERFIGVPPRPMLEFMRTMKLALLVVILSAVLLVPTVPALVFGLFMVMVAFTSPG